MFMGTCTHLAPRAHPMPLWFQGSPGPGVLMTAYNQVHSAPSFLALSPICTLQPALKVWVSFPMVNPPRLVLVQFLGFLFNNTSSDSSRPLSPILPLRPVEGRLKGKGNALTL